MRRLSAGVAVEGEFVLEALATHAAMRDEVFQLVQARQVHARLRVTPAGPRAHVAPREAHLRLLDGLRLGLVAHMLDHTGQESPRLRRQLIQAAAQHLVRDGVGLADVLGRRLDVRDGLASIEHGLHRPLVLVQQRHGVDEGEVYLMIAPRARLVTEERQPVGIRVHYRQRAQQPLGVLVQLDQARLVLPGLQPRQRAPLALKPVDGLGLRVASIDAEHHAAVQQLFVDLDGGRRQEDHHRPLARYCCVVRLPVVASLPVLAKVSSPSDWSSFSA